MNTSAIETIVQAQTKRRYPNWEPQPCSARYSCRDKAQLKTLQRCVSLLNLELQVGDWLNENSNPDVLPNEVIECLKRNVADEDKHFAALSFLQEYSGIDKDGEQKVNELTELWQSMPSNFATIYALEMGVFFSVLPYLVRHGDMFFVSVSQWISDDEAVHVTTHGTLMKEFKQRITQEHADAVIKTLYFIFEFLPETTKQSLVSRALNRLVSGKDPDMANYSLPATVDKFSQESMKSLVY